MYKAVSLIVILWHFQFAQSSCSRHPVHYILEADRQRSIRFMHMAIMKPCVVFVDVVVRWLAKMGVRIPSFVCCTVAMYATHTKRSPLCAMAALRWEIHNNAALVLSCVYFLILHSLVSPRLAIVFARRLTPRNGDIWHAKSSSNSNVNPIIESLNSSTQTSIVTSNVFAKQTSACLQLFCVFVNPLTKAMTKHMPAQRATHAICATRVAENVCLACVTQRM